MSLDPLAANAPENFTAPSGEFIPTGTQTLSSISFRRRAFIVLNVVTIAAMAYWLAVILSGDGLGLLDYLLLVTFVATAPWFVVGFWNALIGFALLLTRRQTRVVFPAALKARNDDPLFVRTAIFMTIRNEDPTRAFKRFRAVKQSVDATGFGEHFDYYILSDSSIREVIEAERKAYAEWMTEFRSPDRLVYRNRARNTGFKAGNVRDFCVNWGRKYELMIPLDADSLMSGAAIIRLVRIMQANPRIGILQTMIPGMPTKSFFARVFQFGMRQGMRTFTTGNAWWAADCGPFWGHNAAIRTAPFTDYCDLPKLPGEPPFGGHIMSHDYVESVLMRRAGFEVRVLPEEVESYEDNPPALLDFTQRDLRWCNGNLQYFKVLAFPALLPANRAQLLLLIQMFLVSPGVMLFMLLSALIAALWPGGLEFQAGSAAIFYLVFYGMYLSPKLFGFVEALLLLRKQYGGALRILTGAAVETIFTMFLLPILTFNQTLFMGLLLLGKGTGWNAQQRDGYRLPWTVAAKALWPVTALALALLVAVGFVAPAALPWYLPFVGGAALSIPFAVVTSIPELGEAAARARLCAVPEEFHTPAEIAQVLAPEQVLAPGSGA